MLLELIISYLDAGVFIAVFFAALEYNRKSDEGAGASSYHFWWVILVAATQLRLRFLVSDVDVPAIGYLGFVTGMMLIGPVQYGQITSILAGRIKPIHRSKWFLAALIAAIVCEVFYWQSGWQSELALDKLEVTFWARAVSLVLLIAYAPFLFLGWREIYQAQKKYQIGYKRSLYTQLSLPGIVLSFGIAGFTTGNRPLGLLAGAAVTSGGFVILWILIRYPHFFNALKYEINERKYARTQLTGINIDALESRLQQMMDVEKLYKDDELRIQDLAAGLMLAPNRLSRILNEKYGANFYQFINGYRIAEAKRLLIHEPDKTILYIGLEVGFKSKSAFHINFTKTTGQTPNQFRKTGSDPKKV